MEKYVRKLQLVEIEILKEIDRICKKYNIKYFLCNGSLIGAIRHKGFIPWDDDIDIAMTRKNYDRFIKISKDELKNKFFLDCYEINKKCNFSYAKVKCKETIFVEEKNASSYTSSDAIWLDIFPLDGCNHPLSKEHKRQYKIYNYITTLIPIKNDFNYYKNLEINKKIYNKLLKIIPIKFMRWLLKKTISHYDEDKVDYLTSFSTVYGIDKETFKKSIVTNYQNVEFEKQKFMGLVNYDEYLTQIYGNYMKLPPKEKRVNHKPYIIRFSDGEEFHFDAKETKSRCEMQNNSNKETSRTINVIRNSFWGVISRIGVLLLQFICRTIFIKTLGEVYLGLNGLFTNILTILSFAELGLGNAIIYNMYKPIANKDHEEVSKLLKLYRKCYNYIALFIFGAGLLCIPFLNSLIDETPNIKESIYLIYILFLIQSITSYFLTYRRSLISANQKEYICSNADLFSELLASILKIIVLLVLKNYILFLIIQISRNLIANGILYIKSKKMYPEIDENKVDSLSKEETKGIFKNVKDLMLYKISSTINSGTDNIIITKIVGLAAVGLASNYALLIGAVNQILFKVVTSFTAGIGNLNAKDSIENREKVFYTLTFITTWMYGFCTIMLVTFLNTFIGVCWIGPKFLLSPAIVFALVLDFYISGVQYAGYNYAITTGLFKKAKWGAFSSAIINIILSIILGIKFGVFGIFVATGLSRLFSQTWLDPYLVFKYEFKKSSKEYFLKFLRNFIFVLINLIICYSIFTHITMNNIFEVIIMVIACAILCNIIFVIEFFKTWEFKDMLERIKLLIKK